MKVTLGVWIKNLGDGSASPKFFNSEKEARAYADKHEEKCDWAERMCDDTMSVTLEFDDDGKLLNPYYDEYDFEIG